jgi:repressor LexA
VREVQEALGFRAVESARAHLEALVDQGRLAKEGGHSHGRSRSGARCASRCYRLPAARGARPPLFVPVLGRVQAGALTEAVADPEGFVAVTGGAASHREPDALFALRVRGDSMVGAGILDGDLVVVRRQPTAEDGQIVVAQVEGEATVKRLRRRRDPHGGEHVVLCPENPAYAPIPLPPGECVLLGRVIEVRRSLEGSAP